MKIAGIIGYGAYIPKYRIAIEEIAKMWGKDPAVISQGIKVDSIAVGGMDEDSVTISVEAARNALLRAQIDRKKIGAVYSGSESKVYAVKPNATMIGGMLDIGNNYTSADLEFACKAGSAGIQMCMGLVDSNMVEYGLAIGADTSQGKPGDVLEYTAASGGAAFVIGKKDVMVEIQKTLSITSDTPDFWRKNGTPYPMHGERFTGEPAYFNHVTSATKQLMENEGVRESDIDHFIFHMPNTKFPLKAAKMLKVPKEKVLNSLVVTQIGNTYSGSSLLGLCRVLDSAKEGDKILMTSFGSGAGSDSFLMEVKDGISRRDNAATTDDYINGGKYIDYGTYCKYRGKLLK